MAPLSYRIVLIFGLVLTLCLSTNLELSAATPPSPEALVETFENAIEEAIQGANSGQPVMERAATLEPAIQKAFHIPLMARIIAGSDWQNISQSQRLELTETFQRTFGMTLAATLNRDTDGGFKMIGVVDGPQDTKVVKTQFISQDDETHELAYIVYAVQGRYWVVDVIVDGGISELTKRQSKYRQILSSAGLNGLITNLNQEADALAAQQ